MFKIIIAGLLISTLTSCASEAVTNPNLLVHPVRLTQTDGILDGGSLVGTLVDARGQRMDFFINRSFNGDLRNQIFLNCGSEYPKPRMRARYDGWKAEDLYALIERSIHDQFVWDAQTKRLRLKIPDTQTDLNSHLRFMCLSSLLRYVEQQLHRKTTYLQ